MATDKSRFASQALVDVQDFNCTAGTGFTITFNNCVKSGNVKMINVMFQATANMTAGTWYTLGTIPEGYRSFTAKNLIYYPYIWTNSSIQLDAWIEPNGKITVRPNANVSSGATIPVAVTYI